MIRWGISVVALFALSACATVPNAVVQYYPPKANLAFTVTQAVDCNATKSSLIASNSVSDLVVYTADRSAKPRQFFVKPSTGALSDTNVSFTLTEDGRLKSVNGDSTGQVEAVAKAVITVASAAAGFIGGGAPPSGQLAECTTVASWGGGKPVTLTYTQEVSFEPGSPKGPFTLQPDAASTPLYNKLKAQLPQMVLTVDDAIATPPPVKLNDGVKAGPKLVLNDAGIVHLSLASGTAAPWTGDIIVPLTSTYDVPLPKAAAFGKVSFAVTLADSGAITTLTYGQVSGATGPANVANAALGAIPTASNRAAALKAQADEIAQNSRVAKCRADPTNCT